MTTPPTAEPNPPRSSSRGIRWWPLAVFVAPLVVAIVVLARIPTDDRQSINMLSMLLGAIAAALAFTWLVALSRLRWRVRLATVAGLAVLGALFVAMVRVNGVTGDLMPILEWRFAAKADPVDRALPESERTTDASAPERAVPADAADFPEFFAPGRDGKLDGPALATDWDANPPEELWRRPVGEGWSGFAVAGRDAITQEQYAEDEAVVCYDLLTGDVRWSHRDRARYETTAGGIGPRATPTIGGEHVYTLGATGILNAFERVSGRLLWTVDILETNDAAIPDWGVTGSPLLVDDTIVVSAGGTNGRSLVAYDRATGEVRWARGNEPAHWSSPRLATLCGVRQILIFNASEVTSHDAATGEILWSYPWSADHVHVSMPVVLPGNRIVISTGYGNGAHLVQIERDDAGRFSASTIWESRRMKAKFANILAIDDALYGLDDGILACVDLATGDRLWKGGRYGHGQMLLVGDVLLLTSERGAIVLIDPNPEEHTERTRFDVFDEKTWNPPALAGRYLLVRNASEAACFRLPVAND